MLIREILIANIINIVIVLIRFFNHMYCKSMKMELGRKYFNNYRCFQSIFKRNKNRVRKMVMILILILMILINTNTNNEFNEKGQSLYAGRTIDAELESRREIDNERNLWRRREVEIGYWRAIMEEIQIMDKIKCINCNGHVEYNRYYEDVIPNFEIEWTNYLPNLIQPRIKSKEVNIKAKGYILLCMEEKCHKMRRSMFGTDNDYEKFEYLEISSIYPDEERNKHIKMDNNIIRAMLTERNEAQTEGKPTTNQRVRKTNLKVKKLNLNDENDIQLLEKWLKSEELSEGENKIEQKYGNECNISGHNDTHDISDSELAKALSKWELEYIQNTIVAQTSKNQQIKRITIPVLITSEENFDNDNSLKIGIEDAIDSIRIDRIETIKIGQKKGKRNGAVEEENNNNSKRSGDRSAKQPKILQDMMTTRNLCKIKVGRTGRMEQRLRNYMRFTYGKIIDDILIVANDINEVENNLKERLNWWGTRETAGILIIFILALGINGSAAELIGIGIKYSRCSKENLMQTRKMEDNKNKKRINENKIFIIDTIKYKTDENSEYNKDKAICKNVEKKINYGRIIGLSLWIVIELAINLTPMFIILMTQIAAKNYQNIRYYDRVITSKYPNVWKEDRHINQALFVGMATLKATSIGRDHRLYITMGLFIFEFILDATMLCYRRMRI